MAQGPGPHGVEQAPPARKQPQGRAHRLCLDGLGRVGAGEGGEGGAVVGGGCPSFLSFLFFFLFIFFNKRG